MAKARTTIKLDEALLHEIRQYTLEHQITLNVFFAESARMTLSQSKAEGKPRIRLPAFGDGGLVPGMDLADNEVLDRIESKSGWPKAPNQGAKVSPNMRPCANIIPMTGRRVSVTTSNGAVAGSNPATRKRVAQPG